MPEGHRPRGVTPRLRSGAEAESARLRQRRKGQEELPQSEVRAAAERSYPVIEVRGSSREEQSHVQGAVAARAQEGLEELFHVQGQEGWL